MLVKWSCLRGGCGKADYIRGLATCLDKDGLRKFRDHGAICYTAYIAIDCRDLLTLPSKGCAARAPMRPSARQRRPLFQH